MKAIISKAARRKWAWVLALVMIVSIVIPTSLLTAKADVGTVKFIDGAAGWLESAYAQWTIDNQAEVKMPQSKTDLIPLSGLGRISIICADS